MPDWLIPVVVTSAFNGLITVAVMRAELRYWRNAINAAHKRLDAIGAPAAGGDWIPS